MAAVTQVRILVTACLSILLIVVVKLAKIMTASAGNRTRINCLEGSYADHYTTDADITRVPVKPIQLKGY